MMQEFLYKLMNKSWKGFKVAHHAILPSCDPKYGNLAAPLPGPLQQCLHSLGVTRLYCHQTLAIDTIRSGQNIVVATPTSSGKSLIYNLAILESLLENPQQHALYLFPIKALSRDQLESLSFLLEHLDADTQLEADIYDGDTTPYRRAKIRQRPPHILLTNPDMLHYGLLPFHNKWEAFFKKLRFIVVDEMHTYRGIFGSHVAQIFRRLQRVCRHYGSEPQFIFLSATIANPEELSRQLLGRHGENIAVIRENGAPQAKRNFLFLDSEMVFSANPTGVAAQIIAHAAEAGLKTIAFTQSRRLTELVHMSVQRMAPHLADRVSSYRAGFLPEERRSIEQRLAGGNLAAVISTSALEMGIDIGGLDLCILVGYPGTVMTTWQRGGRVGRSGQESAILLIPQPDALDQYIIHHPEHFLSSQYEMAITDPKNSEILKAHLPCAAAEIPLHLDELEDSELHRITLELARDGKLLEAGEGGRWFSSTLNPQRYVDIRSIGVSYTILKKSEGEKEIPLGKNDGIRALKECHPGAIYLHRGETYSVEILDLQKRLIYASPNRAPYFTRVKTDKETEILEVLASKPAGNFIIRLGRLRVTERIHGYERRRLFSQELLGHDSLDLPPQVFETIGFWIEIEPSPAKYIQDAGLHFMGGIHAMEHAVISMFPLFALCDRNDIGGISIPLHPQVRKAAVFIYDGYPGGIGLAARGYEVILPLLEKTKELIGSCTCSEGCPACIHSPKCGSGNKPLDKKASLALLKYLTGDWNLNRRPVPSDKPDSVEAPLIQPEPSPWSDLRIGFLDLETQKLADEVGGWQNKHLMRVSVAILYDTATESFHIYREEDIHELVRKLQSLDLVVGFNILQFDYGVLSAYTPFDFHRIPTLDILKELSGKLGFRVSLSHLSKETLGKGKHGDGAQAVTWFREGKWESLIEYCKRDVALTRDLFFHAVEKGHLLYRDRQGRVLRVPMSWDLKGLSSPGK